jgi:basic secretory peptidase family protein
MTSRSVCNSLVVLFSIASPLLSQTPEKIPPPIAATVATTLTTAAPHIRQFAFDGDAETYFESKEKPGASDHFTIFFDKSVAVKLIAVATGKPDGSDALDAGRLEASADGKKFEELAKFTGGSVSVKPDGRRVRAVRIKPTEDMKHALAIREFTIDSEPAVAIFKYPVEFVVNVDDAPEMKQWADVAARICEREYGMICEDLRSDGFKPKTLVTMTLRNDYNGVAATSGDRIVGSPSYFKSHLDDFGAMVHETVHVVQQYRTGNNPGWLVEGIADYIRFYKYEPRRARSPRPDQAKYDGSYRVTAAFLNFVSKKYDKEIVRKLNQSMREGEYKEEIWQVLTKKNLSELNSEWKASLRR